MSAAEKAYPQTDVGTLEVKTLPAATLIASHSEQGYFDGNNGLFRPLFRYIQRNDIPMTTPVEAEMQPGVMYFYIGADIESEGLSETERVSVHHLPERLVASVGVRGSYSATNFNQAKTKLSAWLDQQADYTATGPAKGVFWNSPMMPGPLKRFEVHIPIQTSDTKEASE